ncbi:TonB-dependent receptor [Aliiglaciecola sp. 2_MG-2023]|uniref:TonB-dependent receptor n=1 Tax=unclassified Aliiglaciecola TaxID=2593648 RepID=UPI0026E33145|nr:MULTISPECIES: TonB-dependent receptor [unclassified Aliiglaciecola]MDO6709726.1 TonB-dependent receptor [Aliiglaciecola sp. 2_MG-2023]MDO6750732.1 TonB-dependent receptor [Aliiglaciecola sp. 1_MG-2023]
MRQHKLALAIATTLSMGTSSFSYAQDESVFETIQITAKKKSQDLQDVSVSVTAFSGNALRELNMTDSVDIAAQTPGLNIGTPVGEGNNPSISLRGVGLNDFNDNNEGPIAVYRDDVYQSAMPGLTFQLFDLERVEVLRGPQGTLYGRNATGGLVHFISAPPTEDTEVLFDLTVAEYNQIKTEAAVGGSLTDSIQARLAIASNNHDGYVENRIGEDANEADSRAYRLQVNFDITDDFTALLNVHGGKSKTNAPQYQHLASDDGAGNATSDFYGYADTDGDNFAGEYNRQGLLDIDSDGLSLKLNWENANYTLTSITAVENVEKLHQEDTDVGPYSGLIPQFGSKNEQFSQEVRLSGSAESFDWIVGAYYFKNEVKGALDLDINYPGPLIDAITGAPEGTFGPDLVPFVSYDIDYDQDTESYGLFGQIEKPLTDKLTLTLGLRYTSEERSMDYQNLATSNPDAVVNSCLIPAGDVCGLVGDTSYPGTDYYFNFTDQNPAAAGLTTIDDDNISGQIGLDYKVSKDTLVFFNIANGFKSGGFNGGFLDFTDGVTEEDVAFDSEELTSYEAGIKTTLASGDVRINSSVFYYDYKNYQALTFAGLSQFINNSDATLQGLDVEVTWVPGDNWDIKLGASLLDTEIESVVVRGVGTVEDREMVLAPKYTVNGIVRYQATDEISAQLDFNHQGEQFFDITNSEISNEDSYTVFNARVGYQLNDNWKVSAFVKNITDEEYRVYSFDFTQSAGFIQEFYARPRWVGVNIQYNYY